MKPACGTCGGRGWLRRSSGFPEVCFCVRNAEQPARQALKEAARKADRRRFTGERVTAMGDL